jgi:class 3 adenylate cyclase/streptogramin lyase
VQRRTGTRGLGTALFTDIVGSTVVAAEMGNSRWAELLTRHHQIVRRELRRFGGRENDTAGDGFFVTFERPVDAIRCAVGAAGAVRSLGIELRAGVSFGELEVVDGKAGGLIVNTAARVMSVAGPGEVVVPASVRDIVSGAGISFADHGTHRLKGLEEEVRLFLVTGLDGVMVTPPLATEEAAERRREIFPGPTRRSRKVIVAGIAAAILAAAAIAWTAMSRGEPPAREAVAPDQFLVELDPESGRALQTIDIPLPRRPGEATPTSRTVAAGQGAVWILAPTNPDPTLIHVDPGHGDVREPIGLKFSFSLSMVSAFDTVWVATADRLISVHPGTDEIRVVLEIPIVEAGSGRTSLASDRHHLWVGRTDGILMRVDPSGTISEQRKVANSVDRVAVGEGGVWVVDQVAGVVTRIDPATLRRIGRIEPGGNVDRMLVSDGFLWILDRATGVVTRISSSPDPVRAQATVGAGTTDMAAGLGSIWVSHEDGTISSINVATLVVDEEFARVEGAATAIAVDPTRESIWVDIGQPLEEEAA